MPTLSRLVRACHPEPTAAVTALAAVLAASVGASPWKVGAAFLSIVAVIPTIVAGSMGIPPLIASFYGGTGLLIVVSVCLDLVQKINSHLVMRNYPGLTED